MAALSARVPRTTADQPVRRRPWRRWIGRVALALLAALVVFLLTPLGRYLLRAGWEEAKILARRREIAELVADAATDAPTRAKLQLVLDARRFAADSLGLDAGESFTTYSPLERDTLVLVLAGAYRDRLVRYTWWFPIVGRVPYKGYFDFARAAREERALEARGYDAYLRPASAFSTLGFFNDPLLSTTLAGDSIDLANTVIHELVHNTFYARGQAVFNESFANFVGSRGVERFFLARGQPRAAAAAAADWAYERRRGAFYTRLYRTLDSAFDAHPKDSIARLAVREVVYGDARRRIVAELAPPGVTDTTWARRVILDNAALLARRVYLTDLELFDGVYEREGRDVVRATRRIIALAKSDERRPYQALRRWLGVPLLPDERGD